ncbi:DUF2500 family protein [Clostridium sp. D33t1_170424_F3]|uniref:DUF2500 family protein n=1 Tax=Clostridium sp. D33t1_170424_F3 TaxID=2787099 RepID=UPI0018AA36FE|nr:DUF2500 family protein [Clostridium sp. D33t1_170424_F3]
MQTVAILFLVLWGASVVCGILYWILTVRERKQCPKCKHATVLHKEEVRYEAYSMRRAVMETQNDFLITFSIDGKAETFAAGPGFYAGLQAGEQGMLYYQGDRVVDFQKDR